MRELIYFPDHRHCSSCGSTFCEDPTAHGHVDWTSTYEAWVESEIDYEV